ncbi:MAG: prevent-host-death family protein [Omnitrophica bacterium RIFCSPHIGHO2_02_FULL_46_11]|nr:MAG: prevent-host-death family protein [Omnitrophica bacterium RIFCSPLOWO2_01_FULL_45_10b]OGW87050.1 MAG: prevent-host-death family protein [Omnitrophica bacterium RIFCSPHIGHO2_02_FULL_46_11]
MLNDIPITEARHELTSLPERLAKNPGAVTLTRRGKPVLAVMLWGFYESLMETMEIMSDEKLMSMLRRGIRDVRQGKGVSWEKAKKDLRL